MPHLFPYWTLEDTELVQKIQNGVVKQNPKNSESEENEN